MRSGRWMMIAVVTAAAAGLWILTTVQGQHQGSSSAREPHHVAATTQPSGAQAGPAVSAHLAEVDKSLDALDKAVRSGDKAAALGSLKDAREHVRQANALALGFANTKCPMMSGAFDPARIAPDLTRQFKGQKVGFCCGGCPDTWDKLTDAEKQAKLDASK